MGDLERAVRWSKRLESGLARRHGATGRGLHEKIDSARGSLAAEVVRDLRLVATVRNKIVHEEGYDRIERRGEFLAACRRADRALGGGGRGGLVLMGVAGVAVAALAVWWFGLRG